MDWISLDGWINHIKSIRKRGTKLFHSNHKHLGWQKHVLIWKWNCIFGQNNCSIICHNSNILKCFLQINEYVCTVQLHTTMRPLVFSCLPPQTEWSGVSSSVVCVSSVYLPSSSFLHWQIEVNAKSSSPQCVSSSICALLHVALPVCQLFHTFTNWGQCQVQCKLIRTSLILILIHEWKIIFC